jgi:hypothetical protein
LDRVLKNGLERKRGEFCDAKKNIAGEPLITLIELITLKEELVMLFSGNSERG